MSSLAQTPADGDRAPLDDSPTSSSDLRTGLSGFMSAARAAVLALTVGAVGGGLTYSPDAEACAGEGLPDMHALSPVELAEIQSRINDSEGDGRQVKQAQTTLSNQYEKSIQVQSLYSQYRCYGPAEYLIYVDSVPYSFVGEFPQTDKPLLEEIREALVRAELVQNTSLRFEDKAAEARFEQLGFSFTAGDRKSPLYLVGPTRGDGQTHREPLTFDTKTVTVSLGKDGDTLTLRALDYDGTYQDLICSDSGCRASEEVAPEK